MPKFNRRDFLKIIPAAVSAFMLSNLASRRSFLNNGQSLSSPNVVIIVFDAMTARNLSLYGYRRKTTPHFERFAQRATVYNAHYSTAPFTTPGTASLLTGVYPWTHRAINEAGLIARNMVERNLFHAVSNKYYRLAFSQNMWPNYFFGQFHQNIDKIMPPESFSIIEQVQGSRFSQDLVNSYRAFDDFLFQDGTPPASLVLGVTEKIMLGRALLQAKERDYPIGVPRAGNYPIFFQLKDVLAGVKTTIEKLVTPSLAYLHCFPPHDPYRPTKKFTRLFADDWSPEPKPDHILGDHLQKQQLDNRRQAYDEYIANLDFEFGKIINALAKQGILESTYIIITSDHGELFERGTSSHVSPLMYEGVIHIPLIISAPGQKTRQDVYTPTSSLDLLPTIARLTNNEIPAWAEGELLPLLGGKEDANRSIFMMDAKKNPAFAPLSTGSYVVRKGRYKLIYYKGYPQYKGKGHFELYDLDNDPEELNDLYLKNPDLGRPLQDELLGKIEAVNSKYEHIQQ